MGFAWEISADCGAAADGVADMRGTSSNAKTYGTEAPGGLQYRHSDERLVLKHEFQTERVMPPSMRMFWPVM
ncbi:hypothetical protein GCM10008164_39730 [Achromobacter xylosoxidans]|nr:hypothetical protein GCM10008164_39730 [Achromobacter xylosoxidans]